MKIVRKSLFAVVAAAALTLTACSGSTPASTSEPSAEGGSTSAEQISAAQEQAELLEDPSNLEFPFPDSPVDMGQKRVAVISGGQNNLLANNYAKWSVEAAQAAGWETSPVFDAMLDPSKMAGFIQQAVSEKYDAIMFSSLDANSFAAAIDAAAAAGIPVACQSCSSDGFDGKLIAVRSSTTLQGEAIAKYIIARSEGKAKVLEFHDEAFPTVIERFEVINAYLEENCPGCTVEETDFSIADLSKPGPPQFTAALASHPAGSITDIIAPYGTAAVNFAKSAQSASRTDFTISAVDTTSDLVLQTSQDVLPLGASPIPAAEFTAWTAVDLLGRQMAGEELYDSQSYPIALAVQANAEQFLPDGDFQPADVDYKAEFVTLWNK